MPATEVRITPAVKSVLEQFLSDLGEPQYGYKLMDATGFPSGKVYQILDRLHGAGWLIRHDAGRDRAAGQRRVTYTLTAEQVPQIRRAVTEADEREQRGSRVRVHLPRLAQSPIRGLEAIKTWATG